jgi:hypothetical protein
MLIDQSFCFENPEIPEWLYYGLLNAFKGKNKDFILAYQKEWEEILNGR